MRRWYSNGGRSLFGGCGHGSWRDGNLGVESIHPTENHPPEGPKWLSHAERTGKTLQKLAESMFGQTDTEDRHYRTPVR